MIKVVIIHGNGGCTSQSHWTPWLKAELEKKSITVLAPTMPDNVDYYEFTDQGHFMNKKIPDLVSIILKKLS
ncbi:hypothetical protein JST56_02020 [Candidatus Dependentiae bacterium]|jgi:predicted alpha/beta hydrolase family esterase|nr:hypothetical protein [Candidatus Dependentiae bacterium]